MRNGIVAEVGVAAINDGYYPEQGERFHGGRWQ